MKTKKLLTSITFFLITAYAISQDSVNIGFSLGDFHVERWQKDREYFVESANALGARVFCEYAYGDKEKQIEQVRKLINRGIKVIVVIPTDATAFARVIEEAHSENVIIISYDRLMINADVDYFISFDNRRVGREQATYAIEHCPKGNYVLLGGPLKDNNALEFMKGQKEILQPYIDNGDVKIVHEKHLNEWSSMDAFLELQSFFESNNTKVDVVIASNDLIASGVNMAFEMLMEEYSIILTGQDANVEAVKNINIGKQSMTIYKPIMKLAYAAAKLSVDLVEEREVVMETTVNNQLKEVQALLLDPIVVTKANLEATVIADGYYTESEIFEN